MPNWVKAPLTTPRTKLRGPFELRSASMRLLIFKRYTPQLHSVQRPLHSSSWIAIVARQYDRVKEINSKAELYTSSQRGHHPGGKAAPVSLS